ncbi:peptide ABC transporter substrate-binding protein [Clostridium sp. CX1]|uniref:peptide ABC transporter substrate-binding protein n=1 Tax=Clostridium sp. CX1 TaxID=2978346 RepID=UPI0021C13CBF|nr:peptide ABC transporter substrate-binding protein [Clostridium sp. CX1]MCT8976295.1 peptide ABC transporter substrate-binding protein [Clostridium sp. CX1]
MRKLICYILILSNLLFNGCVEKSVQGTKSEGTRNYVVYNIGKSPEDLIMLNNHDFRQQDLLINLFEGLVTSDEKGKIKPAIAESWSLNKDETCYTFKIRKTATWNNGEDITAEDFVTFFSQVLNKDRDNVYAKQLYCIFGAEDYKKGKGDFSNVAVRALDEKTLEIRLNYPCNYFLNILAEPIYSLRKINEDLVSWKKNYKNILYSGCYKIDNILDNGDARLKKNEEYWNNSSVKSEDIMVTFIDSSEASLAAFESSKIDIFTNPPISELSNLSASGRISKIPFYGIGTLVFNLRKEGVIQDSNLRKSISAAVSRKEISKEALNDTVKPATAYIPPNVSDGMNGQYLNKEIFTVEPEKAKALDLISKSKYENNKEELKLIYLDSVENKKICDTIAKQLRENLKLKVQCKGYSLEEFSQVIRENDYDIAKVNYESSYDYPLSFLERYTSESEMNLFGYKNAEFDTRVERAKREKDMVKKVQDLREAENILMDDMPIVPLYFTNSVICKKNNIDGIYTNKRGNIKLDKVYIKVEA